MHILRKARRKPSDTGSASQVCPRSNFLLCVHHTHQLSRAYSGLGSVISPLVCQSIIATGVPWYRFYYGSLVLSGLNVLFLFTTFKPTAREAFRDRQTALHDDRQRKSTFLEAGGAAPLDDPVKSAVQSGMWFRGWCGRHWADLIFVR